MKSIRFHEQARIEFVEQTAYYEAEYAELGRRFRIEVESSLKLVASLPLAGSPFKFGTRRVIPRKFPFSIVYVVLEREIVVLAVAHFKRKPGYWKGRKGAA